MESRGLFLALASLLVLRSSSQEMVEKPVITSMASNLNILEGESVLLPCNIRNMPERTVRIWRKVRGKLATTTLFSGGVTVTRDPKIQLVGDSGSLAIEEITPEYAGQYVCQVAHEQISLVHTIRVLVPPSIQPDPPHAKVIARKDGSATMTCNATGLPAPLITWTYSKRGKQMEAQGATLVLHDVEEQHSGLYKCTADNDVYPTASITFNLTVLYGPELSVSPDWMHGDDGATVEFSCTSRAAPISRPVWLRGDKKQWSHLAAGGTTSIREKVEPPSIVKSWLRMKRLNRDDLGTYTCFANNSVGEAFRIVEVSGLAEPVQLRGNESGEGSFLLAWTVKSYSPIIEYQLKIRKFKGGDEWTDVVIPAFADHQSSFYSQSYNVTGLETSVRYEAVMQAHNDFGWNRPSDTLLFGSGHIPPVSFKEDLFTVFPVYEAELDITDSTMLMRDLASSSHTFSKPNVSCLVLFIVFVVFLL